MKKSILIITILIITTIILGICTGIFNITSFNKMDKITNVLLNNHFFNWYESQAQDEIENANKFAEERLEKKYHVFVNNIFVDIGYEWDGTLFVPIRTIGGSLNWLVNWIPELGVIQLVKGEEEANVDIVNFFGKAYVDLNRLETLLRLQEVNVHGGNIEIKSGNYISSKNISFNKLDKYDFYIDNMKMTDRAILYEGQKYIPSQIFALSFGKTFRYDVVNGHAYIENMRIDSIFVDGIAYSTIDSLKKIVDTGNCIFKYRNPLVNKSDLPSVIFKGPKEKVIALTFDDYLGDNVYPLLDVLKENDVKATFYIIGNSVKNNGDIIKAIVEQGHEIANHTWDHFNLHTLRDDEVRAQLISTQLVLQRYGGIKPTSFRPPGGYYDNKIVKMAEDIGLKTILWSLNSTDADTNNGPEIIKDTILKIAHPGSIVVMHMGRDSTIKALTTTIKELRGKGYNFVTISEIINDGKRE